MNCLHTVVILSVITFKSIVRDNILRSILSLSLLYAFIPFLSLFSMRQVTELNMNISLGLTSFILLLLTVFLGGTTLWKDIDRKYVFTTCGLPISRGHYLLGKYLGVAAFIIGITFFLGTVSFISIQCSYTEFKPIRDFSYILMVVSFSYEILKFLVLMSVSYFLSTVSTSFFLPIFGTISVYIAGNVSQEVYDFILTETGQKSSQLIKIVVSGAYYILPNFSAFDIKTNVIYNLPVTLSSVVNTMSYGVIYLFLMLTISVLIFSKKEFC